MSLIINKAEAKDIYQNPKKIKSLLEENFGKNFLTNDITKIVTSVKAAYRILNKTRKMPRALTKFEVSLRDLEIVIEALNEDWVPNWNNNEEKWFPTFSMDGPSGFRFYYAYYDNAYSSSAVGSRLCFKERRLLIFAVNHPEFFELFKAVYS